MYDEFVVDLWSRVKPFVSSKDRLEVAEAVVSVFDEYGFADGLDTTTDCDSVLQKAIDAYFGDEDAFDDNEDMYDD